MGGLHIHNWATGKSVHLVVYAGESISRFICHSGAVPRPANHTTPGTAGTEVAVVLKIGGAA